MGSLQRGGVSFRECSSNCFTGNIQTRFQDGRLYTAVCSHLCTHLPSHLGVAGARLWLRLPSYHHTFPPRLHTRHDPRLLGHPKSRHSRFSSLIGKASLKLKTPMESCYGKETMENVWCNFWGYLCA